jgi:hypothetical protein
MLELKNCKCRNESSTWMRLTEWFIKRAMFPLSVASTTTSSLILKSCKRKLDHSLAQKKMKVEEQGGKKEQKQGRWGKHVQLIKLL